MDNQDISISIDGKIYQVKSGINLLEACLSLEKDLPYFCWHSELGSVGSCRQCAVMQYQNKDDNRGRLVMACMTPVTDGMIVSLNADKAHTFRATAIEAMMTNHPHDCPVCEEGGDCHLQDMTLMSGHISRTYPGQKRTHQNQYLGPLINHEMNRCIGCYRCVRFYREYCGGTDLNVFSSRNNIYFGRIESGILASNFSGNLAEVCPTGVFTDKPFSDHYTRKWDLQTTPTICTGCSLGCNIYASERTGIIRKITNRLNPEINGHFICDRGRFGYQHVNHEQRLTKPWLRNNKTQSVDVLNELLAKKTLKDWLNRGKTLALGSERSCIENNTALERLVGKENFYAGISNSELTLLQLLNNTYANTLIKPASILDIENTDATLIIGEDVSNTAPRLSLAIRQATRYAGIEKASKLGIQKWQDEAVRNIAQECRSPLHIINTHITELRDVAKNNIKFSIDKQLNLLNEMIDYLSDPGKKTSQLAQQITEDLLSAKQPGIVTGLSHLEPALLYASLKLTELLKQRNHSVRFYCVTHAANSLAIAAQVNENHGIESMLENSPPSCLIIMETDLYRFNVTEKISLWLDKVENIIVFDHILTPTVEMADLVLPVTSSLESFGSWLNAEGRIQQSAATMSQYDLRRPSWLWLANFTCLKDYQQLIKATAVAFPELSAIAEFITPRTKSDIQNQSQFVLARQSHRSTGRTAINTVRAVKESPPKADKFSEMTFSMEGVPAFKQHLVNNNHTPVTGVWTPKWNSGQSINRSQANTASQGVKIFSNTTEELQSVSIICSDINQKQKFTISPYSHIYCDDEFASFSSALEELMDKPYIYCNPQTAEKLNFGDSSAVCLHCDGYEISLPYKITEDIANNVLLLPTQEFKRLRPGHKTLINGEHYE